ncbi:MAG TPA: methyltransferase domain-containing protein [Gemmatimonadales bacterium]|nr:methyltransferase domain-containing protein [Gemmatimonadales bacterium]
MTRAGVRAEYAALASVYERRWAAYVARTTARTLARLALRPGERLLDVGCGTGALLRAAARQAPAARLAGADLSDAMLREARALATPAALVAADAAALPVATGGLDVVASASALHYWTAPDASLGELARVLRPGGRLVLTDWCADFRSSRLAGRWLRLTRRPHHRIYGSRELARRLAAAGFRVTRLERYRVGWLWGMMTVSAERAA